MEKTSLGQKALQGGMPLNKLSLGLYVKYKVSMVDFKPFRQGIEYFPFINRFRIDENLIHVSMFG